MRRAAAARLVWPHSISIILALLFSGLPKASDIGKNQYWLRLVLPRLIVGTNQYWSVFFLCCCYWFLRCNKLVSRLVFECQGRSLLLVFVLLMRCLAIGFSFAGILLCEIFLVGFRSHDSHESCSSCHVWP